MSIRATMMDEREKGYWVQFWSDAPLYGDYPFFKLDDLRILTDWMDNAGITPVEVMLAGAYFTKEEDAMLCLLAFR